MAMNDDNDGGRGLNLGIKEYDHAGGLLAGDHNEREDPFNPPALPSSVVPLLQGRERGQRSSSNREQGRSSLQHQVHHQPQQQGHSANQQQQGQSAANQGLIINNSQQQGQGQNKLQGQSAPKQIIHHTLPRKQPKQQQQQQPEQQNQKQHKYIKKYQQQQGSSQTAAGKPRKNALSTSMYQLLGYQGLHFASLPDRGFPQSHDFTSSEELLDRQKFLQEQPSSTHWAKKKSLDPNLLKRGKVSRQSIRSFFFYAILYFSTSISEVTTSVASTSSPNLCRPRLSSWRTSSSTFSTTMTGRLSSVTCPRMPAPTSRG